MYARQSQLTGRDRLRSLREISSATAERMDAERARFDRLASDDSAPRVVAAFNLFQTPPEIAHRVASMFDSFGRTLEPSAGLGRLYHAMRARDDSAPVTLVDVAPDCCGELYRLTLTDHNANLVQRDFLECTLDDLGQFDSILMNPPFKQGRDVKHIKHALTLLAPGGRLVSLCANGPRQREHLQPLAAEWHDLPAKSFASEGTGVNVAMVVIDK